MILAFNIFISSIKFSVCLVQVLALVALIEKLLHVTQTAAQGTKS